MMPWVTLLFVSCLLLSCEAQGKTWKCLVASNFTSVWIPRKYWAMLNANNKAPCKDNSGPSAVNPRFEQKGGDVLLTVDADVPEDFFFVEWKFNNTIVIVRFTSTRTIVTDVYKGRLEFPDEKYSVKLKNLQEADSGVYTARVFDIDNKDRTLAEYTIIVQGAVPRAELTVDSVVSRGSDCNLTVTCTTQDSHINSTFRCDSQTCSQEGGERAEVTTSGSSLHIFLLNSSIICNHSNQVNWTTDVKMTESVCIELTVPEPHNSSATVTAVVVSLLILILIAAVLGFVYCQRRGKCKRESIENTIYETPQVGTTAQPPDQTPTDDPSCVSPTSTYCLVGPHVGPLQPRETRDMSVPEQSLYAQVGKPGRP